MAILLFTTTDIRGSRGPDFTRLMASVAANQETVDGLQHYVLLQNCLPDEVNAYRSVAPACCRFTAVPGRLSISEARNRLMVHAQREQPLERDDIVGFPDDDCWLPEGFLARLTEVFAVRRSLDLFICRVSLDPDTEPFGPDSVMPASARQVVRLSTSNNIFLRASLVAPVGPFDPGLGLGTPAGGGEDTDYAIRVFLKGSSAGIIDRPLVGHPVPDRSSAAKYFRGAMIVLARHARRRPDLMIEFLRKILVGIYFFARGKLTAKTYRGALRDGARAFRSAAA